MSIKLLYKTDLAEQLGRSVRAIEWMEYSGTGPKSALIAGRRVWRQADVDAWIEAQFAAAAKESA